MFPQSHNFPCSHAWLSQDSFLAKVLLFCDHTDSPIVGASDMSKVSTYPLIRHYTIIWPLIRTQEGNMSRGCSQDLKANDA